MESSSASRKRTRTVARRQAQAPPVEPQLQPQDPDQHQPRPARVIRYLADAVRPDQQEPIPVPLPPVEESTLLDFHPDSPEYTVMQRLLGKDFQRARVIDWDLMVTMEVRDRMTELLTPRWLRLLDERRAFYQELTIEFLSTFSFDSARLSSDSAVSFALGRRTHIMSIQQFAVHARLYTQEETTQPVFTESLMGWSDLVLPRCVTAAQLEEFWTTIADGAFVSGIAASQIRDPIHRFIHRVIACTVHSRYMSIEKVTYPDLYALYCIVSAREANLAMLLLFSFSRDHGRGKESRICMGSYVTVLAESLGVFDDFPRGWLHEEAMGTRIKMTDMRQMSQLMEPGQPPRFTQPRAIPEDAPIIAPLHQIPERERAGQPRARPTMGDRLQTIEQVVGQLRQGQEQIRQDQIQMRERQEHMEHTQIEIRGILQHIMEHFQIPPPRQLPPP